MRKKGIKERNVAGGLAGKDKQPFSSGADLYRERRLRNSVKKHVPKGISRPERCYDYGSSWLVGAGVDGRMEGG